MDAVQLPHFKERRAHEDRVDQREKKKKKNCGVNDSSVGLGSGSGSAGRCRPAFWMEVKTLRHFLLLIVSVMSQIPPLNVHSRGRAEVVADSFPSDNTTPPVPAGLP